MSDFFEYRFTGDILCHKSDMLIAFLDEMDFSGFIQGEDIVLAYTQSVNDNESRLRELLDMVFSGAVDYSCKRMKQRNWNEEWERSFEPVLIENSVYIRASFHKAPEEAEIDILVDPKMSFGTGHHPTTRLMIRTLLDFPVTEKKVLDMGCGTGILAILAGMQHAEKVIAVDIDEWAVRNSRENVQLNHLGSIRVIQGNVSDVQGEVFDVCLANINRNTLLDELAQYKELIHDGGMVNISGYLRPDQEDIIACAQSVGMEVVKKYEEGDWCAAVLKSQPIQMRKDGL